ncbi:hypothetical protein DAPPUDRAFT_272455, partial [Daphnia pulex]
MDDAQRTEPSQINDTPPKPVTAAVYFEEIFGYKFKDEEMLHQALKRPTASLKSSVKKGDRLELVGDAVLDLIMIEECFERHVNYEAGQLSGVKCELTCNDTLARKAEEIQPDYPPEKCPKMDTNWHVNYGIEATIDKLESILNYSFKNRGLLKGALTHRYFSALNYERLEFLGDIVL